MKKEAVFRNILIFGIIILLALLSMRFHFRFDLSKNNAYTLSPYSRVILSKLDSEVTITWYRSASLLQYTPAVRYIEDFLEEYRNSSDPLLSFKIIEPSQIQNKETLPSLGLVPRQIEIEQNDGKTVKDLYSGLIIEYKGQKRVIPFFIDTATLEYDLTRLILELQKASVSGNEPDVLQVVYGNTTQRDAYQYVAPWVSYAGYTVKELSVPLQNLDTKQGLLVIGSTDLDNTSVDAIDSFLSRGGNAVFFVSGNTVNTGGDWSAQPKTTDMLLDLLREYGISIESPLVLDVSNYRITMPALDNSKNEYINYPFWITANRSSMDTSQSLLFGVHTLQFYWPSSIFIEPNEKSEVKPLVSSSASSIIMNEPYNTDPFGNQKLLFANNEKTGSRYLVVSNTKKGRMLVIADEYMPSTIIEYTNSDTNLDFLVNCVEWISLKDELLGLKNIKMENPESLNLDTDTITSLLHRSRLVNLIVVPALIGIIALIIVILRKKMR